MRRVSLIQKPKINMDEQDGQDKNEKNTRKARENEENQKAREKHEKANNGNYETHEKNEISVAKINCHESPATEGILPSNVASPTPIRV